LEEREAKLEETRVEIEERGRQLEASVVEMTNQLKQAQVVKLVCIICEQRGLVTSRVEY